MYDYIFRIDHPMPIVWFSAKNVNICMLH